MNFRRLPLYHFFYKLLEFFGAHQHFTGLGSFFLSHDTRFAQLIHDPRRPVETDLKDSLQHTDGSLVLINDKTARLRKILVVLGTALGVPSAAGRPGPDTDALDLLFDIVTVDIADSLILQKVYHIRHFFIRDKGPLHTRRFRIALRIKEHIALSQQLLRSHHIQDRPRIHAAGYGERYTAWHICLDQTRDNIH